MRHAITHWGRDKWMPFRRRHFQTHFLERKVREIRRRIYISHFQSNSSILWLIYLLWNWHRVLVTGPNWLQVNYGSGAVKVYILVADKQVVLMSTFHFIWLKIMRKEGGPLKNNSWIDGIATMILSEYCVAVLYYWFLFHSHYHKVPWFYYISRRNEFIRLALSTFISVRYLASNFNKVLEFELVTQMGQRPM